VPLADHADAGGVRERETKSSTWRPPVTTKLPEGMTIPRYGPAPDHPYCPTDGRSQGNNTISSGGHRRRLPMATVM